MFVCYYRGKISSASTINEDCKMNKTKQMPNWCRYSCYSGEPFHKRTPPSKHAGLGLHYWSLPIYNQMILEYMNIKDGRNYLVLNDSVDLPVKIHLSIVY